MKSLIPALAVTDMERTLKFYSDVLGFSVTFTLPNKEGGLDHASVTRGETQIMFGPLRELGPTAREGLGKGVVLYLTVGDDEDIDAYFERVKAAGTKVVQEPTDQFWGMRDWGVADPDGYLLYVSKETRSMTPEEMIEQAQAVVGAPAD